MDVQLVGSIREELACGIAEQNGMRRRLNIDFQLYGMFGLHMQRMTGIPPVYLATGTAQT